MRTVSTRLYECLKLWLHVADGGIDTVFDGDCRNFGLCGWVAAYARFGEHAGLISEFRAFLPDSDFPFNESPRGYVMEDDKSKNPLRRAWVEARVKDFENKFRS